MLIKTDFPVLAFSRIVSDEKGSVNKHVLEAILY
ncbi:uncharacterized protein METZ01_LOCUS107804, partial [marine metagenome]